MTIQRIRIVALSVVGICVFGAGIVSIAGFLGKYSLLCDLASCFRVQFLIPISICCMAALLLKHWKLALIALFFASINLVQIAPLYIAHKPHGEHARSLGTLKIIQTNVNTGNRDYSRILGFIREMDPDIVAMEELDQGWVDALSQLRERYPYNKEFPRSDNFGIGLYSKMPLKNVRVVSFGSVGVPSIVAQLKAGGQPVTVIATHPVPPWGRGGFNARNEQLAALGAYQGAVDSNLIVLGDLNTTNWSYHFKKLTSRLKLHDARRGYGIIPSWPAMNSRIKRIPIDFCLAGEDFATSDFRVGPDIGSDHFPLYVELELF